MAIKLVNLKLVFKCLIVTNKEQKLGQSFGGLKACELLSLNMKLVEGLVLVMKIQVRLQKMHTDLMSPSAQALAQFIGLIAGVAFEMLAFLGVFIGLGASAGIAYGATQTEMKNKQDR